METIIRKPAPFSVPVQVSVVLSLHMRRTPPSPLLPNKRLVIKFTSVYQYEVSLT